MLTSAVCEIEAEIRTVPDLRAIWRGGLSYVSYQRFDDTKLQWLSNHKGPRNLQTYLAHGMLNFTKREAMIEVIEAATYDCGESRAEKLRMFWKCTNKKERETYNENAVGGMQIPGRSTQRGHSWRHGRPATC